MMSKLGPNHLEQIERLKNEGGREIRLEARLA
jgi:hypothetical protein